MAFKIMVSIKTYISLGAIWMALNLSPFLSTPLLADSFDDNSYMLGATGPQLALDDQGNAIVVWQEIDSTYQKRSIWARRYEANSGWGEAHRISSKKGKVSASHTVAVDADGNAIVVWAEWKGKSAVLWANRDSLGKGWGDPTPILQGEAAKDAKIVHYAFTNEIVADGKGNNFILWGKEALAEFESEMDGSKSLGVTGTSIYINRLGAAQDGRGEPIYSNEAGSGQYYEIATDGLGNVYVMRQRKYSGEGSGEKVRIEVSRYETGKGWSAPVAIEDGDLAYSWQTFEFIRPHIAADSAGNVMAVWQQSGNVRANRYDGKSNTWGRSKVIEPHVNVGPEIAANKNGDLLAAWNAMEGENASLIFAKRYVAGRGWEQSKLIHKADTATEKMRLAVDARGNAIIVWTQYGGSSFNIWANNYNVNKGWEGAVLIDVDTINAARDPEVGVDDNGNAIAVWSKWDGKQNNIYFNRYVVGKGWLSPKIISPRRAQ